MAERKVALIEDHSLPGGFRAQGSGSGLIVPEDLSRTRQVITKAQWKTITRAIDQVCKPFNMRFVWQCNYEKCPDRIMQRRRTANGFVLYCGCHEYIYDPAI